MHHVSCIATVIFLVLLLCVIGSAQSLLLFADPGRTYQVDAYPSWVAFGDFNGDGSVDIAVSNDYGHDVSVLLGNGDGTFQSAVNYGIGREPFLHAFGGGTSVDVGDFNGDGKLDLLVPNWVDNCVSVLLGNGDGTFQPALNYDVGVHPALGGLRM